MSEGNFEAKLTAKRETAAGIYLTIQVQPDDYKAELATLRVGSALMLGWAEIVDSEVEAVELYQPKPPTVTLTTSEPAKERRPFATLPLSQQAAIRCGDAAFLEYIGAANADVAAKFIRRRCKVESRAFITDGTAAGDAWVALERDYQAHLTTRQYADARR